jgi:hypothetical protein
MVDPASASAAATMSNGMMGAAAIGAGASLLGGMMGRSSDNKVRKWNELSWKANMRWQKDLAHRGIRMKVGDAKKAGIHPLYALGNTPFSASPIPAGFGGSSNSMGEGVAQAGQDISRAMMANANREVRDLAIAQSKASLEGMEIENEMKRAELASLLKRINGDQIPPSFPYSVGRSPIAESPYFGSNTVVTPVERPASDGPKSGYATSGSQASTTFFRTTDGVVAAPSELFADSSEENIVAKAILAKHQYIDPAFGDESMKPQAIKELQKYEKGVVDAVFDKGVWKPVYGKIGYTPKRKTWYSDYLKGWKKLKKGYKWLDKYIGKATRR